MDAKAEAEELEILGITLDRILSLKTREQQIAGLRCFTRGLMGWPMVQSDLEILEMK